MSDGIIEANGISIGYSRIGSGEPVLLISGLGYSRWEWHAVAPLLAERHEVISFDNRGGGASSVTPGLYTARLLATDALALLDALGISRAHVVGHSLGSFIAQEMALAAPERISTLTLVSSSCGGTRAIPIGREALAVMMDRSGDPELILKRALAVAAAPGFAERDPALFEAWLADRRSMPVKPEGYRGQLNAGVSHDSAERVSGIRCPTTLVHGELDQVVPPGNSRILAELISGSRVVLLPEVGHLVPLEAPVALVKSLAIV